MTVTRTHQLGALLLAAVLVVAACGNATVLPSAAADSGSPAPASAAPTTAAVSAAPTASPTPAPTLAAPPTEPPPVLPPIEQLIGQRLVITLDSATPSASVLDRIRRGEVGGVILFGSHTASAVSLAALTAKLHNAAADGGQPPLLVMTDQEGGIVRRLGWAPPVVSAWEMGRTLDADGVRALGRDTGEALAAVGIDSNLAPVADVPVSKSVFIYADRRVFSFDAAVVANLSVAFASGLLEAGILPSMKHFPGIGRAIRNTDLHVAAVGASRAAMEADLAPYRAAIAAGVPMIMLSNAVYAAWDAKNAAGWSPTIINGLLRDELGFAGVTITDSLDGAATSRNVSERSLALRAAQAGADFLLLTGSEKATAGSYALLLAAARDGRLPTDSLLASYERILALKASFGK
jgi:beta-N-acetylhexosaminidase